MERFKSEINEKWSIDNPESLVRDRGGEWVKYEDYLKVKLRLESKLETFGMSIPTNREDGFRPFIVGSSDKIEGFLEALHSMDLIESKTYEEALASLPIVEEVEPL